MSAGQSRQPAQPSVEGVKRWMEWIDRRDQALRARLQKLVRPGRSFEWLYREWWRRENERHSRRTICFLEAVARNKYLRESETDQPVIIQLKTTSLS